MGAVSITDKSRTPNIDMFNVLGIGVAVNVKTSTLVFNSFNRSLCLTPKRCSSSIINNPKSANFTSFDNNLCVPTTISNLPVSKFSIVSLISLAVLNLDKIPISTGKFSKRCSIVS